MNLAKSNCALTCQLPCRESDRRGLQPPAVRLHFFGQSHCMGEQPRDSGPRAQRGFGGLSRYAACRPRSPSSKRQPPFHQPGVCSTKNSRPPLSTKDVTNRIVIDNGFNERPLHWLRGGVVENENRVTRGLPKKALKLRDWHSERIGNLQYFARSSARAQTQRGSKSGSIAISESRRAGEIWGSEGQPFTCRLARFLNSK